VDVLRFALEKENIRLETGFEVEKVKKTPDGFRVESAEDSVFCDKLIVACGGLAGTKLGGSMAGYKLLAKLGHKCTKLRPTLVQLKCAWGGVVSLKGVRANCHARILRDGQTFAQSQGELQFTDYGISGPVVFEISRDVCQGKGQWTAELDFLPDWTEQMLAQALAKRGDRPVEELLTGILHNRLGRVLTRCAGVKGNGLVKELTEAQLQEVARCVKCFRLELTEPLGMDSAQVTAGGVITDDFDPATMESKLVPGLYACGEVLDVDGDCGGYNLQWAWSSGRMAGLHAGGNI
jgi:predicted Rossmann fold flavoprotein